MYMSVVITHQKLSDIFPYSSFFLIEIFPFLCFSTLGIPAIVIIIVLIINKDFYGGGSQSEKNPFSNL